MKSHAPRWFRCCAALVTALCSSQFYPALGDAALEPAFADSVLPAERAASLQAATPGARPVTINPRLRNLPATRLNLAPGLDLDAERVRLESRPGGDFVWVGRLRGEPLSQVTIASRAGVVAGHINRPLVNGNLLYTIRPTPDGLSLLQEDQPPVLDDDHAAHDSIPIPAPAARSGRRLQAGPRRAAALAATFPAATAANPAVIDVLIAYTPATTARYGGALAVEALALEAIASANTAYQNSGIHITVNLLHAAEVDYTETSDMNVALSRLANPADGVMDNVHSLREDYGADLVVLFDQDSNYCGLAYQMSTVDTSFAANAFSVVNTGCIATYAMTHEMAHNMGSHHDRDNAFTPAAYSYSYGHKVCTTDGSGYRTVMSYACYGVTVPRVNHFSNPTVTFNGTPTGVPSTDSSYAADNSNSLNNTAHTVAQFRTRSVPVPTAPTTLAAAAMGSTAISLAWTDTATSEDYYQIERSADATTWSQVATVDANATSYCDNSLTPGTTAEFRVRACNSAGCSDWSNIASATTTTTTTTAEPAPPTGLIASASSSTRVDLAWTDNAQNETGFRIERSADGASFTLIATVSANISSYADTSVAGGETWYYRVIATGDAGDSAASSTAAVTTPADAPPTAPSNLRANAQGSSSIRLTWYDRSDNETGFEIERSSNGGSTFTAISTTSANATSFTDTGLASRKTYTYRIRAVASASTSAWTAFASARTK